MPDRYDDMYEAAVRYHVHGETMESIARTLRTSRSTVSRLLGRAREEGVVRVSVAPPRGAHSPAARAIEERFGVRVHVVTVGASVRPAVRLERVARQAAAVLSDAVGDGSLIGVGWGVTLTELAHYLEPRPLADATVVALMGSANPRDPDSPHVGSLLQNLGQAFDARVVQFPVPAFFDYPATREAMWRERSVRYVLDLRSRLDVAVFGVGSLRATIPSHVYTAGFLDADELRELAASGVVGDVCTVMLREDGTYADLPFNARATGLVPDELARVPRRVCVVADPLRAAMLLGALRAGCATDLVCDNATARAVADRLAAAPGHR